MKPIKELTDRYFSLLLKEIYSPGYSEERIQKKEIYDEGVCQELDELEKEIRDHPDYQGRVLVVAENLK